MYELGWFGWPLAAWICLTAFTGCKNDGAAPGCCGTILMFVVCGGLLLFWHFNLDYFIGYTAGLLIFGAGCVLSQARGSN